MKDLVSWIFAGVGILIALACLFSSTLNVWAGFLFAIIAGGFGGFCENQMYGHDAKTVGKHAGFCALGALVVALLALIF